jgi:hypothetical protein
LLDINPAGQWMWLESMLSFPIARRIAGLLGNPSSKRGSRRDQPQRKGKVRLQNAGHYE